MKLFTLNIKKVPLFIKGETFFYERDLDESIKSCTPGEWVSFSIAGTKTIGFINNFATKSGPVTILRTHESEPLAYIREKILSAIKLRKLYGYDLDARLVYGDDDGLPGLIVDSYQEIVVIQINKAGMDLYRNEIKEIIEGETGKKVYFLDNESYRSDEGLPVVDCEQLPEFVSILENSIKYRLPKDKLQKVGYYYDHRENRRNLQDILQKFNKPFTRGLDLFCYIGSWGLNVQVPSQCHMHYVDQADMENVILENAKLNNISTDKVKFTRSDVFKFLEGNRDKYDLVVCDPPAFTKSEKNRNKALAGYERLYKLIFPKLEEGALLVAASCTKYISLDELDGCVQKAAGKEYRKLRLLDFGKQGWDHPMSSLKSKSNYIKYICYYVE